MTAYINKDHEITSKISYFCHPHHRNNNPKKAQWIISRPEEIKVFNRSHEQNWLDFNVGWGLHIVNNTPKYLGTVRMSNRANVFVAKFIDSSFNSKWHGYPADHMHSQDRPPEKITYDWILKGFLDPVLISRLVKGQPCKL